MALTVQFDNTYEFEIDAPAEQVFALLADIPSASGHHPGLDRVVDLGGGDYRWEMKKLGTEQHNIQTRYTSRYVADAARGTVAWTKLNAKGDNAWVDGSFTITSQNATTHVRLQTNGELTLPLPSLMKILVVPFAREENRKLNEMYVDSLIAHFGAGRRVTGR